MEFACELPLRGASCGDAGRLVAGFGFSAALAGRVGEVDSALAAPLDERNFNLFCRIKAGGFVVFHTDGIDRTQIL